MVMEEFNLIEILNFLWRRKSLILKVSAVSFFIGLILYFTTPKEYEATLTLLSEIDDNDFGGFSGLGSLSSLAGIALPNNKSPSGLPSTLYPDVLSSLPFLIEVYQDSVSFEIEAKNRRSIESYFLEYPFIHPLEYIRRYTLGLPGLILAIFKDQEEKGIVSLPPSNNPKIDLTPNQSSALNAFKKRLSINTNKTNGLITISVIMPDRQASADIALIIKDKITEISTNYKIQKLRSDLDFINSRYKEAKQKYSYWQRKAAEYRDGNKNIYSAIGNIDRNNIQDEYSLAYGLYQSLAKQYEQKGIELKQETPVFTVLQPVIVPLYPSSPSILIVFAMTFIGFILTSVFLIFQPTIKKIISN
jgi:uncharacterized protein involved in exopolysaccharide biosynthesis